MRNSVLITALAVLVPGVAVAGDFHMISRQQDGTFHASHKIFQKDGENLYQISLCGRSYFARAATVAWMNYEAEEGRDVGLEFNQGRGWFRVCENPDAQVKLADIGVPGTNIEVMRASDEAMKRRQRFIYIRKTFADYKNSGETTPTFHAR